jgi:hypothetical protein
VGAIFYSVLIGADTDSSTYSPYILLDAQLHSHIVSPLFISGIIHIRGLGGYADWRYLLLIEGIVYFLPGASRSDSSEGSMETKYVVHGKVRSLLSTLY